MTKVLGKQLKVGDTIDVWWQPNKDTIVSLKPYNGPLKHFFPGGAQIAEFLISKTGMTIDNQEDYEVLLP